MGMSKKWEARLGIFMEDGMIKGTKAISQHPITLSKICAMKIVPSKCVRFHLVF